jgi:hypothetical protein
MSSSQHQHALDLQAGRHGVHAEIDRSKAGLTGATGLTGTTGLIGTQPLLQNQQGLLTQSLQTQPIVGTGSIQTTTLISNEPKSVISQEQRIAANIPITTEKHVTVEYVPVTHEEIVTRVPVVTGQAVHTGQALAGQAYVQQIGAEIIQQEAAAKIDLIPEVSTQLSAQHVVNVQTQSQPQVIGKATVIPSQQFVSQQRTQMPVTTQKETIITETRQIPSTTQSTFQTQSIPVTTTSQMQSTPVIGQPLKKF